MRIKKLQLRRLIREAIDPREMEEPLGGWAGNALTRDPELAPRSPEEHAREKFKVGDLVRSVDYRGDGWGGDFERVLGNFPGTIVDIDDDDLDGTQYVVNWPAGEPTMVTASELELVTEGNSTDPRGLKALLASLNVKGRDFRPVANALSTAYHDFEGGPQDMKDEVEIHSGGLSTSTDGDWIDWPLATYQEIWDLYEKARQEYKPSQASGPRF